MSITVTRDGATEADAGLVMTYDGVIMTHGHVVEDAAEQAGTIRVTVRATLGAGAG